MGQVEQMINFYGDYHTHTIYSHGKNTIFENAFAAQKMGFKQIAITDHGFAHIAFGLNRKKVEKMKKEIDVLRQQFSTEILLGIESNLINKKGVVDLNEEDYDMFDIILCNFHYFIIAKGFINFSSFYLPNLLIRPFSKRIPELIKKMNTKALVNAVKNNRIDVITHINTSFFVDTYEIAKVCADYGTFIELSGKKIGFSDEEFLKMAETGVKFIINSDAHKASRIGDFEIALDLLKRTNYPLEKIVNYNSKPKLRSKQ
jgi:putative hydrolase